MQFSSPHRACGSGPDSSRSKKIGTNSKRLLQQQSRRRSSVRHATFGVQCVCAALGKHALWPYIPATTADTVAAEIWRKKSGQLSVVKDDGLCDYCIFSICPSITLHLVVIIVNYTSPIQEPNTTTQPPTPGLLCLCSANLVKVQSI